MLAPVIAPDPAAGTVYATNTFDNTVSVIDASTDTVTATIHVGGIPLGVAADPTTKTAYVANYGAGTVSVINAPCQFPSLR